jgi:hypothetical protein
MRQGALRINRTFNWTLDAVGSEREASLGDEDARYSFSVAGRQGADGAVESSGFDDRANVSMFGE